MSYVSPRDTRKVRLDGLGVSLTFFFTFVEIGFRGGNVPEESLVSCRKGILEEYKGGT